MDTESEKTDKSIGHNERKARRRLIQELFNDLYETRRRVYWFNFWRGIYFGLGSVLGGTILVAIFVWILAQFMGFFPSTSEALQDVIKSLQQ